jgi:hypothetical protein
VTTSVHARGIVIAGALAALALALGFLTLAMNQTASKASTRVIVPLKDRPHLKGAAVAAKTAAATTKKVVKKRPNPNLTAALKAGLPRSIAEQLAKRTVVIVELWSNQDSVGALAEGEAKAGAALAGAGFVAVNVDVDGGAAGEVARVLGEVPTAPAVLVYRRPAILVTTLPGFNDRTVVQQAAASAGEKPVAGSGA